MAATQASRLARRGGGWWGIFPWTEGRVAQAGNFRFQISECRPETSEIRNNIGSKNEFLHSGNRA